MHGMKLPSGNYANFNGDFSGDVRISYPAKFGDTPKSFDVPFNDLVALVAEAVRRKKISDLEEQNDAELLGL